MTYRMVLGTAVAALICVSAAAAKDDANAADLARMQGDWMVAMMKVSGEAMPDDVAQSLFRTVEGDHYHVSRYTKVVSRGTFKIDATQSPKTIDSTPTELDSAPAKDDSKPIRGIYEFDGDKLRICNARPGQPRPNNFDAKMYTGHTLIVWEPEGK